MKYISTLFEIIILFLAIFLIAVFFNFINTPLFLKHIQSSLSINKLLHTLYTHLIGSHRYFISFSLFITFLVYFAFVDLKIYKVKKYRIAILALPLLICIGIYYYINFLLPNNSNIILQTITPSSIYENNQFALYPIKTYHLSFLVFIIIPGAVLFNNKDWYLKTVIFLLIYTIGVLFIFKYINQWVLKLLISVKNIKGFPPSNEMILAILYVPIGLLILNMADSIRQIKARIDLGKVKKIQH